MHSGSPEGIAKKGVFRRAWNHLTDFSESPALNAMRRMKAERLVKEGRYDKAVGLGKNAVPALEKVLFGKDPEKRFLALDALLKIGNPGIPALGKALHDDVIAIRARAATSLYDNSNYLRLESVGDRVLCLLLKEEPEAAAEYGAEAIPALVDALDDKLGSVTSQALKAMVLISQKGVECGWEGIGEKLKEKVMKKGVVLQADFIVALAKIRGLAAAPFLVGLLERNDNLAQDAAHQLMDIVRKGPEEDWRWAMGAFARAMMCGGDDALSIYMRSNISGAVFEIVKRHKDYDFTEVVPALVRVLGDNHPNFGNWAGDALEEIGLPVVPALLEGVKHGEGLIGMRSAYALGRLGKRHPQEVGNAIIRLINGEFGDRLAEINERNDEIATGLNEALLECGKALENGA
ncbi:HEAT repeat domain-containing protein [Candidatus Micrarchaeota archaeon]|nr:HEAT repeat domain-containing protein [Candidatus Micrarchaeota archaeon]